MKTLTLTEDFNEATVKKGETFFVELASNPSTGYRWDMQLYAGKASLVKEGYVSNAPPGSMICGGDGKQVFVYKAEEAGTIKIDAQYKRAGGKTPAKSQSFSVTVK